MPRLRPVHPARPVHRARPCRRVPREPAHARRDVSSSRTHRAPGSSSSERASTRRHCAASAAAAGFAVIGVRRVGGHRRRPRASPRPIELVVALPHEYLAALDPATLDARTAVCVLTHDERLDVPAIRTALALPVGFVGAMGARSDGRTSHRRCCARQGSPTSTLARLHSPARSRSRRGVPDWRPPSRSSRRSSRRGTADRGAPARDARARSTEAAATPSDMLRFHPRAYCAPPTSRWRARDRRAPRRSPLPPRVSSCRSDPTRPRSHRDPHHHRGRLHRDRRRPRAPSTPDGPRRRRGRTSSPRSAPAPPTTLATAPRSSTRAAAS